MPHLVMEYTRSVEEQLNVHSLLEDLHDVLIECGLFLSDDIKSRTVRLNEWRIGEHGDAKDFIHVTVDLLEGRSEQQKNDLATALMNVLAECVKNVFSLSIQIRDMEKASYQKRFNLL